MKTRLQRPGRSSLFAAAAAAVITASAAHADTESGKLMLSGYTDSAAGVMLATHNYEAVIDKLAPHSAAFSSDEVAASTNLCVAYVAMHRLGEARDACDEAVKFAKADQPGVSLAEHRAHEEAVSLALANRAVLEKLGE